MTIFSRYLILKFIVTVSILDVVCDCVLADSLWMKRATVNYNLFDDNRGKRIGDIVTIIVSETTNILNTETNTTDNSTSASGSIDNDNFVTGLRHALTSGRNAKIQAQELLTHSQLSIPQPLVVEDPMISTGR